MGEAYFGIDYEELTEGTKWNIESLERGRIYSLKMKLEAYIFGTFLAKLYRENLIWAIEEAYRVDIVKSNEKEFPKCYHPYVSEAIELIIPKMETYDKEPADLYSICFKSMGSPVKGQIRYEVQAIVLASVYSSSSEFDKLFETDNQEVKKLED